MPLQFEQPEERVSPPQPLPAEQVAAPEPITQADPKQKRVQRLLRSLSPFNKVRKLAEPVLKAEAPAQSPPASLQPIQKSFSRNFAARWREKEVALAYLSKAHLTDEQKKEAVSFLSKFLLKSTRKRITRLGWNLFLLEGTILGSLGLFSMNRVSGVVKNPITAIGDWWDHTWIRLIAPVMNWIDTLSNTTDSLAFWVVFIGLIGIPFVVFLPITLLCMAWDAFKLKRTQGDTLDTLGVLEEVSAIPAVAEYASKRSASLREKASAALIKLYGHLTPEHLGTFPAQTVPNLCNTLSRGDIAFLLQTLHALELIGDVRAVPALKQLAEKHESVEVRETAQRLIYILEAREEGTVQKMSLLRASRAPKEASEHLLRPAHGKPETDVSELLRPSQNGEE